MIFTGYGSTFGKVDAYGDTIAPGAFRDAVSKARFRDQYPAMLLQHGGMLSTAVDMTPIGIWMSLVEDDKGLLLRGKLADTAIGRDLWSLMTMTPRPAIQGLSIGFRIIDSDKRNLPVGAVRRITNADLGEVSIVTFPADSFAQINGTGVSESVAPSKAAAAADRIVSLVERMRQHDSFNSSESPKDGSSDVAELIAIFRRHAK